MTRADVYAARADLQGAIAPTPRKVGRNYKS